MSGGLAPFPIDQVRAGSTHVVASWQQPGGQLDAPFTFEDWTPLQLLTAEGCLPGVKSLLACGACAEGRASATGRSLAGVPIHSPLHLAARYGHASMCTALCSEGGAWANARDSHGFMPLHYAATHNHPACAESLLAAGADPRLRSSTSAAAAGGKDKSQSSSSGYTPAEIARAAGHLDMATLLEEASGDTVRGTDQNQLRAWLDELGCGEYYAKFLAAGYDFGFIALHGLDKDDVDAIGVPLSKLGLRKKLMTKYNFPKADKEDEAAADESGDGDDDNGSGSESEGSGDESPSSDDEDGSSSD